jgi:L-malate glycosyltransferase
MAIELLSDDEKHAKFKEQAFAQANKFDIHNIIPIYESLYSRFCTMECETH